MELFDYIKIFFSKPNEYKKLNNAQKSKHHFILNRFMSIKYPIQANMLNEIGINGAAVADSWQLVASQYKRVPGWIYTKTKKGAKNEALKLDKETLDYYASVYQLSNKDIEQMKRFFPNELKAELKKLEKQMKTSGR
jgi:hypothetical protein